MPDDVVALFKQVFFVIGLIGGSVVQEIRDAAGVAAIGHDADMAFKDDDIAALPTVKLMKIQCFRDGVTRQKSMLILNAAKVDGRPRRCKGVGRWR